MYDYSVGNPVVYSDLVGTQAEDILETKEDRLEVNKAAGECVSFEERLLRFRDSLTGQARDKEFAFRYAFGIYDYLTSGERDLLADALTEYDISPIEFAEGGSISLKERVPLVKRAPIKGGDRYLASQAYLRSSELKQMQAEERRVRQNLQELAVARAQTRRQWERGKYRYGFSPAAILGHMWSTGLQKHGVSEETAEGVAARIASVSEMAFRGVSGGGIVPGKGLGGRADLDLIRRGPIRTAAPSAEKVPRRATLSELSRVFRVPPPPGFRNPKPYYRNKDGSAPSPQVLDLIRTQPNGGI